MTGELHAWNETTTIDTETMIFNNEHKYLHVPGPYLLKPLNMFRMQKCEGYGLRFATIA